MAGVLFLLESPDDADIAALVRPGDVALAFDGVTHRRARSLGVEAHRVDELYRHEELWPLYPDTNDVSRRILSELRAELRCRSVRGAELCRYFYYAIKVTTDQAMHFAFLLRKAVARWQPDRIVCAPAGPIVLDDAGLLSPEQNLLGHILAAMGLDCFPELTAAPSGGGSVAAEFAPTTFSFGQPRPEWLRAGNWSKREAGAGRELRILSVGCRDLNTLAGELPFAVLSYERIMDLDPKAMPGQAAEEIVDGLRDFTSVRCGGPFGIDLTELLRPTLRLVCANLPTLSAHVDEMREFLRDHQIDVIAVPTVSSFHLPAALFHHAASTEGIPVVCWMHGGYGAYPSLPVYDETDYREARHHIVYGDAVVDCTHDTRSALRRLGYLDGLDMAVAGSPYLQRLHAKDVRPARERAKIVLAIGAVRDRNNFYYGYDRPYAELSCFDAHLEIIRCLAEFSDRYQIVVKDYAAASGERAEIWRDLLRGCRNASVICGEHSFSSMVADASAVILSWVSTTFIECLFTSADILLFDDSTMTDTARNLLQDDVVFDADLEAFLSKLRTYLEGGAFGLQNKSRLRRYFAAAPGGNQAICEYLSSIPERVAASARNIVSPNLRLRSRGTGPACSDLRAGEAQ